MEDILQFDEKINIEYTPKEFYDIIVEAQGKLQNQIIYNYIEQHLISQLKKDNDNFINSFQEIRKFRRYYTCQIIYDIFNWAEPFIIENDYNKRSFNYQSQEEDHVSIISIPKLIYDIITVCQDKRLLNKIIEIIAYSLVPGFYSYFLSEKSNHFYVNELDQVIQEIDPKKNDTEIRKKPYYIVLKVLLQSVFIMPQFINFLRKVMLTLFTPYLRNEKNLINLNFESLITEIMARIDKYRSFCPDLIVRIIKKLHSKIIPTKNEDSTLCHLILIDCLFNPLQKEPLRYMCADVSSYEIKRHSIQENCIYKNFFKNLFQNDIDFEQFVDQFISKIIDINDDGKNDDNNKSHSFGDDKYLLQFKYIYFYPFDFDLLKFNKSTNLNSILENFKNCAQNGKFTLFFTDNLIKFDYKLPENKKKQTFNNPLQSKLHQMLEGAPILKPNIKIPKNHFLDIISCYLINNNDPLLIGRDNDRFLEIKNIWEKDKGYEKFPTTKLKLKSYFDEIVKSNTDIDAIKQLIKVRGEIKLKLSLSQKALRHMNFFMKIKTVKRLFELTYNKEQSNIYFPKAISIITNPDENFRRNLVKIYNNFVEYNSKKLDNRMKLEAYKDLRMLLSGFFLNCNLKYSSYILLKPELHEIDLFLHRVINENIDSIIQKVANTSPYLYTNTFGSSPTYFSEDLIKLRTMLNANVDPHNKIFLIETVFSKAMQKLKNQLFSINKNLECKVPFFSLLIAFANPPNLFSNVVFMMEYQVEYNYLGSIGKYFTHFFDLVDDVCKKSKMYTEKVESVRPINYVSPNIEINLLKKILIVNESESNASYFLNKIIPGTVDWSEIDDVGKSIKFPVSKKNKIIAYCNFSVLDPKEQIDPSKADVLILIFDLKVGLFGQKSPKRFAEIVEKFPKNGKNVATKIAICNLGTSNKSFDKKDFTNVFDHIFKFSDDRLIRV